MISGPRNLLWLIPVLLLATSLLWEPALVKFLSPHGQLRTNSDGGPARDRSLTLTDVQLSRYENGMPEFLLNAEQVRSSRQGMDFFMLEKVDAAFFDKGIKKVRISGGEGSYENVSGILTLVDDVAVEVKNQFTLRSDALRYLVPYKTLKTAAEVVFQSRKITVSGTSMSYNVDTGAFRVGGRVKCEVSNKL